MSTHRTLYLERNRAALTLGREIAAGGEGAIHELAQDPRQLVKLYHGHADAARVRKLRVMVGLSALVAYPRVAWPREVVMDGQGNVRGYTMRKVDGVSLVPLSAPVLLRRRLPHWTQAHVVRATHDLAGLCGTLEKNGVYIADLNLLNFLVHPHTAEISGIDCDSYSVATATHRYPSQVFTGDYQVPEILSGRVSLADFGPPQFRGAAASLFFCLLTGGGQPYASREGLTIEQAIVQGRYILGGKGVARGCTNDYVWRRYMSLPPRVSALFKRAFIGGHEIPDSRPNFAEWQAALGAYYQDLLRRN